MYPREPEAFVEYCKTVELSCLRDTIIMIEADIVAICNKVDNTKTNYNDDLDHLGRQEGALRWARWRLRTATNYLSQRQRVSIPNVFMDVSRRLLPVETFTTLLDEAKAVAGGTRHGAS
jgi:hypothetical protein